MTIRESVEAREVENLAPWAAKSSESRGRIHPEAPCAIRTVFQRDRDRVVHCRAFRRLAHKTQVFLLASHDHIRTRLTHTLEVAQIAKTIARALRLNEDLTEAIALAHDLGHTPFGHQGEWALDEAVQQRNPALRFFHWEQSLRVVDVLERGGQGLNLTREVREGILGHTKGRADLPEIGRDGLSLEAQAVKVSDRIAYVNHDLEDAVRARVLAEDAVPGSILDVLGRSPSVRIGAVVADIVEQSENSPQIVISPPVVQALNDLKEFLFERVYSRPGTSEVLKVRNVVQKLFEFYCDSFGGAEETTPNNASGDEQLIGATAGRDTESQGSCRRACDYVAGMTDRFAVQRYLELFIPVPADGD